MFGFKNGVLQNYVEDPEVLATLIEASNFNIGHGLEVEPSEAARLIKIGKSPAAEGLAPAIQDQKLLTKLSRDNRKGVRTAILDNPNLTEDQVVEVLKRSLKHDKDYSVVAKAADRLPVDRLLPILKEHTVESSHWADYSVGSYHFRMSGLPYSGVDGLPRLRQRLFEPLREDGVDYLRKLHDAGIEDYILSQSHNQQRRETWFEKGMLTWMVPEMRPEVVQVWLATLLARDIALSEEDVREAQKAIAQAPDQMKLRGMPTRLTAEHDPAVYRILMDMGGDWGNFVRYSIHAPADLRAKFAEEMNEEDVVNYPMADIPPSASAWELTPEALEECRQADVNWLAPEVVNVLAERLFTIGVRAVNANRNRSHYSLRGSASRVTGKMVELIWSVHPDERHKLSYKALVVGASHPGNASFYHFVPAIQDWAESKLDDKPSVEKVADGIAWSMALDSRASVLIQGVALADRVSLFLGKPLELMKDIPQGYGQQGWNPRVTYMVALHYFGDDALAWQMATELEQGWEDGLVDLAETVCATVGRDLPEEVVDIADLKAEAAKAAEAESGEESEDADAEEVEQVDETPTEDAEEAPKAADADPEDVPADKSDDDETEPAAEADDVESDEEPAEEVSDDEDPTPATDEVDTDEDPTEETDAAQSDNEDVLIPLELTAAVQFSLF